MLLESDFPPDIRVENEIDSLGDTSTLADPSVVDALVGNRK